MSDGQLRRQGRESFNTGWTVRPKSSIFASLAGSAEAVPVTLPHDAIITTQRAAEHNGGQAYFPGGCFEYSKTFEVPEEWRARRVHLEFGGVYRDAVVFVNNVAAGQRPNGYSPFLIDLNPYLRYGEPNVVRVEARAHHDSRWYTGAGIYRDTSLIVTELVHVAWRGVRVTTPDVDRERAVVEVAIDVRNDGLTTETVSVEVEVVDDLGRVVASGSTPVTTRAGSVASARIRTYVEEPRLWNVDDPQLYTATVRLRGAGGLVDEQHTTFGIRTLRLDPVHGLRINGEQNLKLRGACVHHDNGILGAAAIGRAEERKIELLKAAGFNAIRSSHNPLSEAMLEACDRIGMLVIDEAFDVWTESKSSFDYSLTFQEWWERDLEAMVLRDLNHPSVVLYSIGNEIPETGSPLGSEWGRRLAEKVRSLDPTRFVTNGINGFVSTIDHFADEFRRVTAAGEENGGVNEVMTSHADLQNEIARSSVVTERTAESFGVLDVAGMNYADARYPLDRELFPDRIILGSETFPPRIADNWSLILDSPQVIGDFTWTGFDYLGEVGIGRAQFSDSTPGFTAPFPWIAAWCGDLDLTGFRRPASYYREIVFGLRTDPYIAVQRPENYHRTPKVTGGWAWSDSIGSWTWPVESGTPIRIEVYSGGDEVELLLDGKTIARQAPGEDMALVSVFETEYRPGELTAVAYWSGTEIGRTTLHSAVGATTLAAVSDRGLLVADDADLAFVAIELRDAAGTLITSENKKIAVSVEGAGVLQALGSARPDNAERYDTAEHTTFDGRALAIVRPIGTGAITVSITADGLEPVVLTLTAEAPTRSIS